MATTFDYFNRMEESICVRINRLSDRHWVRALFSIVSRLGDGWFWGLMSATILLSGGHAALAQLGVMLVATTAGVVIYKLLKHKLVRERPYINHQGIFCGTAPLDRYSFPSGHTLHAVSFTVMLYNIEPLLLAITLPFAALVAASRMILGLHYPTDVIVGAIIGASIGLTASGFM